MAEEINQIVLEPTALGTLEVPLKLGRLEAGKVHDISIEVVNPTEHDYEVTEITSSSEKVTVQMAPSEVKAKQTAIILISIDIPMAMEPLDADLKIDGIFIIGGE